MFAGVWAAACDRNGSHRTISRSSSCPRAIHWSRPQRHVQPDCRYDRIFVTDRPRSSCPRSFGSWSRRPEEIPVLNATDAFEPKLEDLRGVRVVRRLDVVKGVAFALTFVTRRAGLRQLSIALAAKAIGDVLLWFAYPKGTSKKCTCDFHRDDGWDAVRESDSTTCVKSRLTKIRRHSDSGATSSPSGPGS